MAPTARAPIALIGLMGAGKSSVARVLGERLGVSATDLDALLEAEAGESIAGWFERGGEPEFRRRESELLERVVASGAPILACGGGVVLDPGNRRLLRERCRTVWLEVSPNDAASRLSEDGPVRPLLEGGPAAERLRTLLDERAWAYAEVAERRVSTSGRSIEQVAEAVLEALGVHP